MAVTLGLSGALAVGPGAGATSLSNARTQAKILLAQINRMNADVGALGQR